MSESPDLDPDHRVRIADSGASPAPAPALDDPPSRLVHELGNMLLVIRGQLQVARRAPVDPATDQALAEAQDAATRANEIARELGKLTRELRHAASETSGTRPLAGPGLAELEVEAGGSPPQGPSDVDEVFARR